MPRIVNPFFPNLPVNDPGRFSGRLEQLDEGIDSLFQITNDNSRHTIITGDRGIGKSSFLLQLKKIAEGDNTLPELLNLDLGVKKYNYQIAWHDCDYNQKPINIVRGLLEDMNSNLQNILSKFKIKINLGGLAEIEERSIDTKTLSELVIYFVEQLKTIQEAALKEGKDGLLLFIDELDRVDSSSGFGTFFKLTAERLNRENLKKVAFICAGITGAIQQLGAEHASIDRTFRDIPIPRLSREESDSILKNGFDQINYTCENIVYDKCFRMADGFPEPIHVLGSEMIAVSTNSNIVNSDYEKSLIKVVSDVKKNKLKGLLEKAGYGKYQQILKAMSSSNDKNVPVKYISDQLGIPPNEYSTNLKTLVDRDLIKKVDRGLYSFTDPLLKEYIKQFGVIENKEE